MCVCGMLHPVLDHGSQRCQTGSQGQRTARCASPYPGPGPRTRTHTCVLKAFARPPGVARDSALLSAASRVSSRFEGGPCVELQGPRRPKGVRGCLPAWNVPGGSAASQSSASHSGHKKCGGHRLQGGIPRGLVLQKTREHFQVLSGGFPVLSALSSC